MLRRIRSPFGSKNKIPALSALLLLAATACLFAVPQSPHAADKPVLLELFTSEGCSSCPPIDSWVQQLDASQSIPGVHFIVLGEHIDYFDHEGWKDPFSSPDLTSRQRQYAASLRIDDVYTPQMILNGNLEVHRSSQKEITQSFEKAASMPMLPTEIVSATLTEQNQAVIRVRVDPEGSTQKRGADIYLAIALDRIQTDVRAGENGGKRLTDVAVTKSLTKIGKLEQGKLFDQTARILLWPGVDPKNLRVIAFVQEPGPGKVLGAAMIIGLEASSESK